MGIVATAGFFQFTPPKRGALQHCRMPMSEHGGSGLLAGAASGVRDGAICVGCCWAFMAVFLAVGVMNLGVMAGLAAVIFAEKLLPGRALGWLVRLVGFTFLILAVVAIFRPSLLPGLRAAGMGEMHAMMGG